MSHVSVLTEQDVLQQLNIPNFRHLSRDKVMSFASMLDQMDPEVAKKALEQFPEFAKILSSVLTEYSDVVRKNIESNDESEKVFYEIAKVNISIWQKELENDALSFEQRKEILNGLLEIQRMVGEKDSEGKKFRMNLLIITSITFIVGIEIAASALGGSSIIRLPKLKTQR